jgi:hypothetical protein
MILMRRTTMLKPKIARYFSNPAYTVDAPATSTTGGLTGVSGNVEGGG